MPEPLMIGNATIESIQSGHPPGTVKVSASYKMANIYGSITFVVPLERAKRYHIGMRVEIMIGEPSEAGLGSPTGE